MTSAEDNLDLEALRKLLNSWQVGVLFELFKEEDIGIKELIMMDCGHIKCLLKDFKMGVRIRFEFNLKHWRQKLGLPLKTTQVNEIHGCSCNNTTTLAREIIDNITAENITTETTTANKTNIVINNISKSNHPYIDLETNNKEELNESQLPSSPQSACSNISLLNIFNSDDGDNSAALQGSTDYTNHNDDNDIDNLPLQALGEILSSSNNKETPKFPSKNTADKTSVNLKKILKASGPPGASIVKYYNETNRFTNVHRSQIIQIIVDYFINNDLHLSLNLSHNLEWEILNTFPTEKLEYYRTEKRGKIYAKFSNMKRYKRERSQKTTTEVGTQSPKLRRLRYNTNEDQTYYSLPTNENQEHNSLQTNDDSWHPIAEPEIVVKEESLVQTNDNDE